MANRRKKDRAEQRRVAGAFARRASLAAAKATAVLAGIVAIAGAVRYVHRFATTSPSLAITTLSIVGNDRATELEIRTLAGIAEGDNFFRTDTEAAERQLRSHPWIADVSVSRSFPQGVEISVLERKAAALVDLGGLYLVDRGGELFKKVATGDPFDLPVVTGLPREEWSARPKEAREKLGEVLDALEVYSGRMLAGSRPLSEIHFDEAEGLTLYLGERGMAVKLGRGDLERKLERLERVIAVASRRGEELELVRLDHRTRPGWVAARLAEGEAQKKGG
ncbi:cell division protein FtsQ/DivIB [Vulgatibacter incomptus]|uniref:Cell division protein FtsQ n=1 Tax=Vulgatibacter incomptus TaxID=1391653 RepID=A0A0K1PED2_9BACT|nr:FtsQ-type POTRA domain-containing protein [Vulgatibacter incomptus]AKU91857.1 Cell division protein FtsQ [Vulgatibacter incomptus]